MSARFEPPSIRQRGKLANAMAAVQAHKPETGEHAGKMTCPGCGSTLHFTIQSNGLSRGNCTAACGIRWLQ